jgi:hypothetical protein
MAEQEAEDMKERNSTLADSVYNYMKVITDKGGTNSIGGDTGTPTEGATMKVNPIYDNSGTEIIGYQVDLSYPNATASQAARAAKQQMNALTKIPNASRYEQNSVGQANDGRTYVYTIAKTGVEISPSQIQAVDEITTAPITQSDQAVPETPETVTE